MTRQAAWIRLRIDMRAALLAALVLATAHCAGSPSAPTAQMRRDCPGPYPDQASSPYVLPWEVGRSFRVWQGSCGTDSHRAGTFDQYADDFQMPIGTPVLAARAGAETYTALPFR